MPPRVEVLVTEDCPHCRDAIETVEHVTDDYTVTHIDDSPVLNELYGDVVPVIKIDDVPKFRVWVDEDELRDALE